MAVSLQVGLLTHNVKIMGDEENSERDLSTKAGSRDHSHLQNSVSSNALAIKQTSGLVPPLAFSLMQVLGLSLPVVIQQTSVTERWKHTLYSKYRRKLLVRS
eukprot:6194163-Amphidinium_carterae.2